MRQKFFGGVVCGFLVLLAGSVFAQSVTVFPKTCTGTGKFSVLDSGGNLTCSDALDIPDSTVAGLGTATAGVVKRLSDGGAVGSIVMGDGTNYTCEEEKSRGVIIVTCPPYSAKGDGIADDTTAIQNAINAAAPGMRVVFPWGSSGVYRITSSLLTKSGVTLYGDGTGGMRKETSNYTKSGWNSTTSKGDPSLLTNSNVLIAIDYVAADLNVPTIRLVQNSSVVGLGFVEWNQDPNALTPTAYQPVLGNYTQSATNPTGTADVYEVRLERLYFINNYTLMKCYRCGQVRINQIFGGPLATGILIDGSPSSDFISQVSFGLLAWKEASDDVNQNMAKWVAANRVGLSFGREDDVQVDQYAVFGGKIGIRLYDGIVPSPYNGAAYGRFTNLLIESNKTCVKIEKTAIAAVVFDAWDMTGETASGTAADTDSCFDITENQAVSLTLSNGSCRGAQGDGINYSPTNTNPGDFIVSGVEINAWGRGATSGKAGLRIDNTNATNRSAVITGSSINAQGITNASYAIYLSGNHHTVFSGNSLGNMVAGATAGFFADTNDFVFDGNRVYNTPKALSLSGITSGFVISNNYLANNTAGSTATCSSNCTIAGNVGDLSDDILNDNKFIGLGSAAARIEFDDQITDEVNILDAYVGLNTQTPLARLDVRGDVFVGLTATPAATGNNSLFVANDGGDANNSFRIDGSSNALYLIARSSSGAAVGTRVIIRTAAAAGNEVDRLVVELNGAVRFIPLASAPASPIQGDMYVDSTNGELCVYAGTAWKGASTGTDANCA